MPNQEQRQREIAYFLWQDAGRPDGMDLEFWFAAQQRTPAAPIGRGDPEGIDVARDAFSRRAPAVPEAASPAAKKKKRAKR